MTLARQLNIATRGLRGSLSGDKFYINETLTFEEGATELGVLRVDTVQQVFVDSRVEVVSVEVKTLDLVAPQEQSIQVEVRDQSVSLNFEDSIL